jgi:hypothetical protein
MEVSVKRRGSEDSQQARAGGGRRRTRRGGVVIGVLAVSLLLSGISRGGCRLIDGWRRPLLQWTAASAGAMSRNGERRRRPRLESGLAVGQRLARTAALPKRLPSAPRCGSGAVPREAESCWQLAVMPQDGRPACCPSKRGRAYILEHCPIRQLGAVVVALTVTVNPDFQAIFFVSGVERHLGLVRSLLRETDFSVFFLLFGLSG